MANNQKKKKTTKKQPKDTARENPRRQARKNNQVGEINKKERERQKENQEAAPPPPPAPEPTVSIPENSLAGSITPNTSNNESDKEALERLQALIASGESFGERLASEFGEGSLGRLSGVGPEMEEAVNRSRNLLDSTGRTDETARMLALLEGRASTAGNLTDLEQEILELNRNSLGGLSAAENEALRLNAYQGMDRDLQTSLREAAAFNARNKVRGGAAAGVTRDIMRDRGESQRGLERDLLLADLAEQRQNRAAFTALAGNVEGARAARQESFGGLYGNTLLNANNSEFANRNAALNSFSTNTNLLEQARKQTEAFNLAQQNNELQSRLSARLSGIGTITGLASNLRGEQFAKETQEQALRENQLARESAERLAKQQMRAQLAQSNQYTGGFF